MGEDLGETAERPLDFQPDRTITGAVPFRESDLAVSQSGRSRSSCSAWRGAPDDGGREQGKTGHRAVPRGQRTPTTQSRYRAITASKGIVAPCSSAIGPPGAVEKRPRPIPCTTARG